MVRLALVVALCLVLCVPARGGDPETDLKSKDVKVRLAAVARLMKEGGEKAEELLQKALSDRDWEVVERAATALGERGGADSMKPLVKAALIGPVRRIRLAAARSLARIDAEGAAVRLARRAVGPTAVAACEAMVALTEASDRDPGEDLRKGITRGLLSKELPVRIAAARGVIAFRGRERRDFLDRIVKVPETSVRAAALNAMIEWPDPADVPTLISLLDTKGLNDVLSRRVIAALVAIVAAAPAGEEADRLGLRALSGGELAGTPEASARFARLAGLLAERPDPPKPEAEGKDPPKPGAEGEDPPEPPPPLVSPVKVEPAIEFALGHESEIVRAAAARALERIRTETALDRAAKLAKEDKSARVRLHALRAVARTRGTSHEETLDLILDRLKSDPDLAVREFSAVALGVRGLTSVLPDLVRALGDKSWEVAACAAVSLGKTGHKNGVEPLVKLADHRDWKMRGAAIIGLGHIRRKDAVPDIIEALAEKDSAVSRTAWEILKRFAQREIDPTVKAWREWWANVSEHFEFLDLEKLAREAKKYGYASGYKGVYEDLDVVVLQSRGDTIEQLLERLTIEHRLTRSGQVSSAGLHPYAVFVANCTGEIVPKDVERLSWFVRTGGYLFGSCWALSETIELVYPGVVRKLPIPGQVLANVLAEPCPTESRYLEGVFGDGITRPIYVLYGSHLIEVLDQERVEVLIDSPQTADTWPEGNLACWFDAGHGVILDSANHFDRQGLERVDGLKTAQDRMAYAMDHMGLTYKDLRTLAKKKIWGSRSKAAAETRDLSAFRFITNFVRHKRRVDR